MSWCQANHNNNKTKIKEKQSKEMPTDFMCVHHTSPQKAAQVLSLLCLCLSLTLNALVQQEPLHVRFALSLSSPLATINLSWERSNKHRSEEIDRQREREISRIGFRLAVAIQNNAKVTQEMIRKHIEKENNKWLFVNPLSFSSHPVVPSSIFLYYLYLR